MAEKIDLKSIEKKLYTTNEYSVRYQDSDARLSEEEVAYLGKVHNVRTDVHRTCINCQARQVIKYERAVDKEGKSQKDFRVPCSYIARALPPGSAGIIDNLMADKGISRERATLVLRATQDPVAWAELMFGFDDATKGTQSEWYLRNYQKEQLRCSSRRIVIREGRRSGKSFIIALKLIYLAFTQRILRGASDGTERSTGPQILIITPYQAQVTNIFEEIESLLTRSPDLAKEITSGTNGNLYVKTPFLRMEFSNGAKISGFVSGVGTKTDGSAGGTLRGQSADIIYLDEMDMIPDEVLQKVVLPIMATRSGTSMIATSTPIGKRSTFYKWCLSDATFKEDHLPSTVLPQWNEIKDLLIGDSTAESFAAEYMATFIEGGFGVFKPTLVWEARQDYSYDNTINQAYLKTKLGVQRPEYMLKCIGIDWNKNAGSEFYVVGFDIDKGQWIGLEATNVSASEFSSIRWKEEVIRLNYKWKPDFIYADEGYGHTIIEDLKLMAHKVRAAPKPTLQHVETAKLVDRLVSFNFSSKVELRSPIDGTIITKSGKDFLVENAIRAFEDQKICFPVGDEQLRKELMNYVVLRRTPTTNRPIYGAENANIGDHRLDAFMLAVGGLYLEHSEYSASNMAAGKPGMLSKEVLEARIPVTEAGGVETIHGLKRATKVGNAAMIIEREYGGGDGSPGLGPSRQNRVTRRGAGGPDTSVFDHYKELKSNKGISTDEQYLNEPLSKPMIGERRSRPSARSSGDSRRNWVRR
jgi:replicative DNA helicase